MIQFQYYKAHIKATKPLGFINLDTFIRRTENPKENVKDILIAIQEASVKKDESKRSELKTKLYSFTPCVNVSDNRAYKSIISFTGLLVLDFDKIDNANEFKHHLFDTYNFIHAIWESPSKRGVKAFVKIPIIEVDENINISIDVFKSYFLAMEKVMEQYNGWDVTAKNCVLPLFIGWDEDLLYREDSEIWNKKAYPEPKIIKNIAYKHNNTSNERYYKWSLSNTEKGINSITDNGHPQLRAIAYALGGYVGAGYVSKLEAISFINSLISSNNYLSKGISGYQKTALTMIEDGSLNPLYF